MTAYGDVKVELHTYSISALDGSTSSLHYALVTLLHWLIPIGSKNLWREKKNIERNPPPKPRRWQKFSSFFYQLSLILYFTASFQPWPHALQNAVNINYIASINGGCVSTVDIPSANMPLQKHTHTMYTRQGQNFCNYNFSSYFICVWSLVSHVKGST